MYYLQGPAHDNGARVWRISADCCCWYPTTCKLTGLLQLLQVLTGGKAVKGISLDAKPAPELALVERWSLCNA